MGASAGGFPLSALLHITNIHVTFIIISSTGLILAILAFFILESATKMESTKDSSNLFDVFKSSLSLLKNKQLVLITILTGFLISSALGIDDLWGSLNLENVKYFQPESASFTSTTMVYFGIAIGSIF